MKAERDPMESASFFAAARGMGILLVLAGHTIWMFYPETSLSEAWTGAFCGAGGVLGGGLMAMFFMISGYHFFHRSRKKCLAIQRRCLLRPYVWTAAAVLLTKFALAAVERRPFMTNGGEYLLTFLLGLNAEGGGRFLGVPVESVSILWFLLALAFGWILYNRILECPDVRVRAGLTLGLAAIGSLLGKAGPVWIFCLPTVLVVPAFLAAGSALRRQGLLTRPLSWKSRILIGSTVLLCLAFGDVSMVSCRFRLGPLDAAGSCALGFLLLRGYVRLMQRIRISALLRLFGSAGFYSLWILCLHGYEKVIFPWYRLAEIFPGQPLVCTVCCFAGRLILIGGMYRLISCGRRFFRRRKRGRGKIVYEED